MTHVRCVWAATTQASAPGPVRAAAGTQCRQWWAGEGQDWGGAVCVLRMFSVLASPASFLAPCRPVTLAPGQDWLFSMRGRGGSVWDPYPTTREAGDTGSSPTPPLPSHVTWKSFPAVFLHLTLLTLGPQILGPGILLHTPLCPGHPRQQASLISAVLRWCVGTASRCFFTRSSGFRSNGA